MSKPLNPVKNSDAPQNIQRPGLITDCGPNRRVGRTKASAAGNCRPSGSPDDMRNLHGTSRFQTWRLMNPIAGDTLRLLALRPAVIVVGESDDVTLVTSVLSSDAFHLTVFHRFADAKALLVSNPPDILVTGLRLGEYNGLHLVLRGKAARPQLAAVVMSDIDDRVLAREAENLGATFVVKPMEPIELAAAIARTFHRHPDDTHPIRAPFERRTMERRVTVGGMLPSDERRRAERRRAVRATNGLVLSPHTAC